MGFVCLGLEHFLHGEVFGTRKQEGKGHNDAFPVSNNSVNSVNSVKIFFLGVLRFWLSEFLFELKTF